MTENERVRSPPLAVLAQIGISMPGAFSVA